MKVMPTRLTLIVFAAALLLSLGGCGGENGAKSTGESQDASIVAMVGEQKITEDQLEEALKVAPETRRGALKARVLDDLISDKVFSREARRAGLDKEPELKAELERARNETLARFFVKKHIDTQAMPSEPDVTGFYDAHKKAQFVMPDGVLLQHIVVEDEEKALEVLAALKEGGDFGQLALQKSICRCWRNKGFHGWVSQGGTEPELAMVVSDIEKGKISDVVATTKNYQIVKVLDRRDSKELPFEQVKEKIRRTIFTERKKKLIKKYYTEARVNTSSAEDGVLAKIGDDAITEETLAPMLANYPENKKEKARKKWVNYFIETTVFSREAKKAGLENDPTVEAELRMGADRVLAKAFRKRFVFDKIRVSEKELEDFYQSRLEEFRIPTRVRAKSILVKTEEDAKRIQEILEKGFSFGALAAKESLHPLALKRAGEIGWFGRGEKDSAIENVAFTLEKGQVSDIIKTEAGYEILKLMDKKGGEIRTLDEARQVIKMKLTTQKFDEEKQGYYQKAGVKILRENTS